MVYHAFIRTITVIILFTWPVLCQGAVILEPADQNNEFYQTRFLFLDKSILQSDINTQLEEPISVAPPILIENLSSSTPIIQAYYKPATTKSIQEIVSKYKSIPGGITLEGVADGLPIIKSVNYDTSNHLFIINQILQYKNPLSAHDMRLVLLAIDKTDLMGVSLGEEDIIYGALHDGLTPTIFLKLADHYLGSIVFAQSRWVALHTFPNGYRPMPHTSSGGLYAVYFNFNQYQFILSEQTLISRTLRLDVTLIPLTEEKASNGGYLPDYIKIQDNLIPSEYINNIHHIIDNIEVYGNETRIQRAQLYGEAAAFARSLKKNNIPLSELAESLK